VDAEDCAGSQPTESEIEVTAPLRKKAPRIWRRRGHEWTEIRIPMSTPTAYGEIKEFDAILKQRYIDHVPEPTKILMDEDRLKWLTRYALGKIGFMDPLYDSPVYAAYLSKYTGKSIRLGGVKGYGDKVLLLEAK
jgi:hypothetical protein